MTLGLTYLTWIALGVAIGGPVLVTLLTPVAYHGAIRYIPWLVIAGVAQHAADLLNVGSFAGRGTSRPTIINLLSAGVALVAYLVLIPQLGRDGRRHRHGHRLYCAAGAVPGRQPPSGAVEPALGPPRAIRRPRRGRRLVHAGRPRPGSPAGWRSRSGA